MFNPCDFRDLLTVKNQLESPNDHIQQHCVYASYRRIRHTFQSTLESFQTDAYLSAYGKEVGSFYHFDTNPKHTKNRLTTTTDLNIISNKFQSQVVGTLVHLPHNYRTRYNIPQDGHLGHTILNPKPKTGPKLVIGSNILDISDANNPIPLYSNKLSPKFDKLNKNNTNKKPNISPKTPTPKDKPNIKFHQHPKTNPSPKN